MHKFKALEPVRLHKSQKISPKNLVGRLPSDLHLLILSHLPVHDIPAYACCSHGTSALAFDDSIWQKRWNALFTEKHGFSATLDDIEAHQKGQVAASRAAAPPTIPVDDDFGDFASVDVVHPPADELGDFVGAFDALAATAKPKPPSTFALSTKDTFRNKFIRAHNLLKPLLRHLSSPPHLILSEFASVASPSLRSQAKLFHLLSLFLSPVIQPVKRYDALALSLRSAMDRFDASLLAAFDVADGKRDETAMKEGAGDWEMGKVWAEKREIFYQHGWQPLDNITENGLDFTPMDDFMSEVLQAISEHGARAVRIFPPAAQVLIAFADRVANEVVGEYVTSLLERTREVSTTVFLQATAACFRVSWKMVDAMMQAAERREDSEITLTKAEDVIYRMFEINMDEYLDEEVEYLKVVFDNICKNWDRQATAACFRVSWKMVDAMMQAAERREDSEITLTKAEDVIYRMFEINMDEYLDEEVEYLKVVFDNICKNWDRQMAAKSTDAAGSTARFLSSHNPAQVKRNVLTSFTNVLLLPVTIVPRTVNAVGGALMTGGSAAVQGISMLNPQRWAGGGASDADGSGAYSRNFEKDGGMLFEADIEEDDNLTIATFTSDTSTLAPTEPVSKNGTSQQKRQVHEGMNQLDLLLSLDVALELIHADREALKRVEAFAGYPGHYGHRVRDTIEELFILMLQTLGERHVTKGFGRATERMTAYKPAEHQETTSVAPLVQFFELVHIGDMIQSMVQVYFDKELAPHIDKTDFLNAVVREKKRFENALDESVAGGLNAGTDVLMNQVEHIILTLTKPREYYPPEDAPLDLGPTKACTEAINCLEKHCKLLKGSTSKEVLEVFHQEIGIRLIAILQKHIKRQIISLNGGFQVIADLNTYHAFISSLKVPSIASDFSHLKMLGHVYIVEDAKDLAQIVRDVTRYGGAYRPEDIYEFIQRRSDWKKIEKVVDKTMYNLSFKEDCVIC
ncbi:F-box protein pof6 [Leucoagaricus sp. SymC.cos]|nr:F-box protein pof6 [Leucoagaricus sp. SymC.cos]